MPRTYPVTGINLKAMPLGESDRLLTVLTLEQGLLRVVAPGARKQGSKLGGRSGLFVVNELLISQGKSLPRITQAESVESYPGLAQDLGKLTAGQYLSEVVLCQALSDQPQEALFYLLRESLTRVERSPAAQTLAHLTQALFRLLALAGLAPQVHHCCLTQVPIVPDFADALWRVGFSPLSGGLVQGRSDEAAAGAIGVPGLLTHLNAVEVALLQQLSQRHLPDVAELPLVPPRAPWLTLEKVLRQYIQYHFDRPIRSATLLDTYSLPYPSPAP